MSVIQGKPPSITVDPKNTVEATPEPYKGVVVDSELHPTDLFVSFVGGYPITVDYYKQRHSSQEGTKDYQGDLDPVYQPYTLIRGLDLMVDSPIDRSQDTTTKDFTISGSALSYNVFRPTEGDVFRYDIGDGNEFLFQVTTSELKTEQSRSVTAINYHAIKRMSEIDHERLEDCVVETLYFSLENLRRGMQPLLRSDQVETRNTLEHHYATLLDLYFNQFYSRNERTLLVPSQALMTYDPFVAQYMTRIIDSHEHRMVSRIELLDVHSRQIMYNKTFWYLMEHLNATTMSSLTRIVGLADTKDWKGGPSLGGIFYSRVRLCVVPDGDPQNVDADYEHQFRPGLKPIQDLKPIPPSPYDVPDGLSALYHPVTIDDAYVLSHGFYGALATSVLEACVLDAVEGRQLNLDHLARLCEAAHGMSRLDQYYYIPILLSLIRIHPRGF